MERRDGAARDAVLRGHQGRRRLASGQELTGGLLRGLRLVDPHGLPGFDATRRHRVLVAQRPLACGPDRELATEERDPLVAPLQEVLDRAPHAVPVPAHHGVTGGFGHHPVHAHHRGAVGDLSCQQQIAAFGGRHDQAVDPEVDQRLQELPLALRAGIRRAGDGGADTLSMTYAGGGPSPRTWQTTP